MGHCKVGNGEGESVKETNLDRFLAKIGRGEMAVGAVTTFTDAAVTEVVAAAGFDFVWIDGEHGIIDRKTAQDHIIAAQANGIASLYRVPACDHTEIKRIIDLDPDAIIVPMVLNEQDARRAVSACRYAIHGGDRGCGYRRRIRYGAEDVREYLADAEHRPYVIIQLEHIEAVRRLDAILSVPGLDGIIIGPYDLSMSMNKPGEWTDPEVVAVFDDCCSRVKASGKTLGVYTECLFDVWKRRGVDYMAIKNDTNAMLLGFKSMLERFGLSVPRG